MTPPRLPFALPFALLLAACPMRGREGQELVGKIETKGNSALPRDALVGRIAHAESGFNIIGPIPGEAEGLPPEEAGRFGPLLTWGDRHPFDPQLLLADAKRMERVYVRHGYYDATVEVGEPKVAKGRVDLTFHVTEGEPTRLTTVAVRFDSGLAEALERDVIQGLPGLGDAAFGEPTRVTVELVGLGEDEQTGADVDTESVQGRSPNANAPPASSARTRDLRAWEARLDRTGPAPLLDEDRYDALKAELLARVKALGHVSAEVHGEVQVDRKARTALATLVVVPGPRYRVDKVVVFGAQAVTRLRVAQAADVDEGAPITPRTLAEVQRRVYALGVFSLVQVDLGLFKADPDRRSGAAPIVVTVSEAPFMSLEAALGLEADQARHLVQVRAKGVHRNLFGGLRKGTAELALGLVWLPTVFEHIAGRGSPGSFGPVGRASVELVQPRVGLLPLDAAVALDAAHELTQAFQFTRVGAHLAFPTHFDGWFRAFKLVPSVNFEQYWGATTSTTSAATSACGPGTVAGGSLDCRILFAELRASWDIRDDQIATRSGVFAQVAGQVAGTPLSEFAYARIQPELRLFVPVHERVTFAARTRYGALFPLGGRDPPGVALFFAGGANSVRTTGAQQLGPRRYSLQLADGVPRANVPAPLGGTRMVEGSVELRWRPTGGAFSVSAYVDGGSLSSTTDWLPDPAQFQWGPGVGVRYHIDGVGPVRFDLAMRVPGFNTTPAVVDPGDTGETTDPSAYTIAPRCGFESHTCYQETLGGLGVNFFLTLGESF